MRTLMTLTAVLVLPLAILAEDKKTPTVLNFKMKALDGKEVNLAQYKGKVVLFVNVASQCGLTSQYKALQQLHDQHAEKGLVIIGVPANEFGAQEPGTNEEIAKFCKSEYDVKFPMLAKVVVKGKGICPLYQHLTSKETNPDHAGDIKWNFTKFLVSRDGKVVKRFEPRVDPNSKDVTEVIESELSKK